MTESEIREKRSQRLKECDWTQVPDAPLTENEKSRWREYRQKLRDIPDQEGFPLEVLWPEEPEKDTIGDNEKLNI